MKLFPKTFFNRRVENANPKLFVYIYLIIYCLISLAFAFHDEVKITFVFMQLLHKILTIATKT